MLWRGFKTASASTDSRRHSAVLESQLTRHSDQLVRHDDLGDISPIDNLDSNEQAPAGDGVAQDHTMADGADNMEDEQDREHDREHRLRPSRTHQAPRHHRFSLLRFRHASDPQLSASYAASEPPPVPALPPPTIITTSPTMGSMNPPVKQPRKKSKMLGRSPNVSSEDITSQDNKRLGVGAPFRAKSSPNINKLSASEERLGKPHVSFDETPRLSTGSFRGQQPPAYGDESSSSLALPVTRLSESSRSDASSGDNKIYAATTTTHTIHTTTTFFRLPRRKKDKGHLFPLPPKVSSQTSTPLESQTPRASVSERNSEAHDRASPRPTTSPARRTALINSTQQSPIPSPTRSPTRPAFALTNAPTGSPGPSIVRKDSTNSHRSAKSLTATGPPQFLGHRGRSSTMGSLGRDRDFHPHQSSSLVPSGRTSTSTAGRKSFGDLFSLSHRLRQAAEQTEHSSPVGVPGTPGSASSKPNSFSMPRDSVVYPERTEDDTPAGYLEKLEGTVNRGVIASILCKSADDFSKTCLRKYMRGFAYFGDSIDMAIRKMLMEVELPKETQQIDRLLQGFANRYCECNPGIFASTDEAYFVTFSILLLHSDAHNKNNKRKMQKQDYVKNTQDQVEVAQDILECFFDNITYTPFIHFDDDVAVNSHRLAGQKSRVNLFRAASTDSLKGPLDPYTLILDNKLDHLRPSLRDVMNTEDTYSATGTMETFDVEKLHQAFLKSGILQIVSARSRPDAFLTPATITNPADAQAGLVDIKAAKVGLLWRKDQKKKKARSPWQEWGAILTSSQLYFFRDVAWIKTLMTQHQNHYKNGNDGHPVVFRPPLTDFKPDALMAMDDSVALVDSTYKKHKNAFVFIKHGGFEEVFLANDDADMNDWIAKLNYAATFRTAGIRMRGITGANYDAQRRAISRAESPVSEQTIPSATGDVTLYRRKFEQNFAHEIMTYRRQLMLEKINEANEKLGSAQKTLENLLRNARHLQVLSPIQPRTREALVFAAGKMSARLKWTRVDIARTGCHRDILRLDMEEEEKRYPHLLGREPSLHVASPPPQAMSPSQVALVRLDSDQSNLALSPKSTKSEGRRPFSFASPQLSTKSDSVLQRRNSLVTKTSSHGSLQQSLAVAVATADLKEDFVTPQTSLTGEELAHRPSSISIRSRSEAASVTNVAPQLTTPTRSNTELGEEKLLREAGLISADSSSMGLNRPETGESDRDRGNSNSTDNTPSDKGKHRSSLRRTLRDSHGSYTLGHHRSRKGKDSGSGATVTEEGLHSSTKDAEGLTRGTGSFTVHGKKASVITFGQDWNIMSTEDRLKMKRDIQRSSLREAMDVVADAHMGRLSVDRESAHEGSFKSAEAPPSTAPSTSEAAGDQASVDYAVSEGAGDRTPGRRRSVSSAPKERRGSASDLSIHSSPEMKASPLLPAIYA